MKDDIFWCDLFELTNYKIHLYTSNYSKINILKKKPFVKICIYGFNNYGLLRNKYTYILYQLIKCLQIKKIKYDAIIIQGYFEYTVIFLLYILGLKANQTKVYLIATNNITKVRLTKFDTYFPFIYKYIFQKSNKIFVHTPLEKSLIKSYFDHKTVKKTETIGYYQYCEIQNKKVNNTNIISFFGPVKKDKPIKAFFSLIDKDVNKKYSYIIVNPGIKLYEEHDNVNVYYGWQSENTITKLIKDSLYIFLSQNKLYNGKLSGNLCDALANNIPIISENIHPVDSIFKKYGPIGIIFNSSTTTWENKILMSERTEYKKFKKNIKEFHKHNSLQRIKEDILNHILE